MKATYKENVDLPKVFTNGVVSQLFFKLPQVS